MPTMRREVRKDFVGLLCALDRTASITLRSRPLKKNLYGDIAQLGERLNGISAVPE